MFFPPPAEKESTQGPPLRIVAFPCIDVWLVVHIHLLFYALDFKENERGPIMLIGPVLLNAITASRINPLLNTFWLQKGSFQTGRETKTHAAQFPDRNVRWRVVFVRVNKSK